MRTAFLFVAVAACVLALAAAQTFFVGSDMNGNPVQCVNGVCKNDKGEDCELLTVSCWDWRCRNVPSRFLCALTDACLTVVCYNPNAEPEATPTPAPVRNNNPFNFDNCEGTRKRKELRCMDNDERAAFARAFKGAVEAGVVPDFTQMFDTNVWEATGGSKFFPWIRFYLRRFENVLREIEPKFKALPYWDFASDSAAGIEMSEIFTMKNGVSKSRDGKCIAKRPYADYYPTYPEEHCIHRGFTAGKPGKALKVDGSWGLENLVNHARNYSQFADVAEYVWHRVRQSVGGELAKRIGPNDPLFYLLLANMDRLWMARQNREDVDAWEYNGDHRDGETSLEDGLAAFGGNKIKGVIETKCISYAESCQAPTNPDEPPTNLWVPYMEENVLPQDRVRRVEGFVQATLTNSHEE